MGDRLEAAQKLRAELVGSGQIALLRRSLGVIGQTYFTFRVLVAAFPTAPSAFLHRSLFHSASLDTDGLTTRSRLIFHIMRAECALPMHENLYIVFPIEERLVLPAYAEYEDIPGDEIVRIYSLQEIAAEKVIAICDRARNEPRDLYDLWHLCENAHIDLAEVTDAIASKLAFRGQSLASIGAQLDAKQSRLKRLWSQRLAGQMATLPEFDGIFRSVRRSFRQAGISAG
jgi:hypothetical protein